MGPRIEHRPVDKSHRPARPPAPTETVAAERRPNSVTAADGFDNVETAHSGVDFLRTQLARASAGQGFEIPGVDEAALQRLVDQHGPAIEALMKGELKPKQMRKLAKTLVQAVETEVAAFQNSGASIPVEDLKAMQEALTSGKSDDVKGAFARLRSTAGTAGNVGAATMMLYMFLVGVSGISGGVKMLGADYVDLFFGATSNPAVGLMSGLLATSLFQSSSATTAMLVAMVAGGGLSVEQAIPMVMGANIGTTVTNTLASLAQAGDKEDFQKTFQAATVHDMFNLMTVAVLLPLELTTGFLEKSSGALTDLIVSAGIQTGDAGHSVIKGAIKSGVEPMKYLAELASSNPELQAAVILVLSGGAMVAGLTGLSKVLKKGFGEQLKSFLQKPFQKNPAVGIATGAGATMAVQSSSVVTSAILPLAAIGALSMPQVLAMTVGANIGTTTTAVMAALAATGATASSGLQVALVHTLFNSVGAAMLYPVKAIRNLPIQAATKVAAFAGRNRGVAMAWVATAFFAVPGGVIVYDQYQRHLDRTGEPEAVLQLPDDGPR